MFLSLAFAGVLLNPNMQLLIEALKGNLWERLHSLCLPINGLSFGRGISAHLLMVFVVSDIFKVVIFFGSSVFTSYYGRNSRLSTCLVLLSSGTPVIDWFAYFFLQCKSAPL